MNAMDVQTLVAEACVFTDLHLQVQDLIREASLTLRAMPDTDRRILADKGSWPSYVRDWQAYGAAPEIMPRIPPKAAAIDRMHQTIGWIAWLATKNEHEAIVAWFSFGPRARTRTLASRLRCSRETIRRKRKSAVQRLVERYLLKTP